MSGKSFNVRSIAQRKQPSMLRDMQRDWENWTTGERVALAAIAASSFMLVTLIQWQSVL
jgi:hypothetical protein